MWTAERLAEIITLQSFASSLDKTDTNFMNACVSKIREGNEKIKKMTLTKCEKKRSKYGEHRAYMPGMRSLLHKKNF